MGEWSEEVDAGGFCLSPKLLCAFCTVQRFIFAIVVWPTNDWKQTQKFIYYINQNRSSSSSSFR